MTAPLVSVVMPCYNGEEYISEAVESVLNQKLKDFELIVVNDGSTDRSGELLAEFGTQLTVINQQNRGLPAARNTGIRKARGTYVAFLDCDDFWHTEFLNKMVAGMEDPRTVLSYCGWQHVGASDGEPFVPPDYEGPDKLHHFLRFGALWPVHGAMVRRVALPRPDPFDENLRSCEDYDLWLKIAVVNRIQLVPHVLAYYRKHDEGQMTANHARMAHYNLLVKKRFLHDNPELRDSLPPARVREYCAGVFLQHGYRSLWQGDLKSAHEIFRYALLKRMVSLKDLKYALPTLLPYRVYLEILKGRGLGNSK